MVGVCRKCDDCRKAWRRKWIGRLMAEHHDSLATWFVTLTYGGGYENAAAYRTNRKDTERFFARVRKRHRFKPVTVSEFGGQRGRAHFHLIMFWKSPPPVVPMDRRFNWEMWPHGWSQCEYPRSVNAAMGYCLGYLEKNPDQHGEFSFGKRPAVGEGYLLRYAEERAERGAALFPRNKPIYQIPGNVKDKGPTAGQLYDYWLDRSSVLFERMVHAWLMRRAVVAPDRVPVMDRVVREWIEEQRLSSREAFFPEITLDYLRRHGLMDEEPKAPKVVWTWTGLDHVYRKSDGYRTDLVIFDGKGELAWQSRDVLGGVQLDRARLARLPDGERACRLIDSLNRLRGLSGV